MRKITFIHQKFYAILIIALSMLGYASESEAPSMEFLEFLAEFSDVADDDFDLLVFHALEDSEKKAHEAATQVVEEADDE